MTDDDVFARAAADLGAVLDDLAVDGPTEGAGRDALVRQARGLLRTLQGVHEYTVDELHRLDVEHRRLMRRTLAPPEHGPPHSDGGD